MNSIISRIKAIREEKKLTQKSVAEKLGIPRSTYASWEDKVEPDMTQLSQLAEIFEVGIETIIGLKSKESDENIDNNKTITLTTSKEQQLKDILQNKAMLKTLLHELAALKAKAEGRPVMDVLEELHEKNMQNLIDLTRQ